MYEVVWVRQFGNIFGNTVYSVAFVMALFMLGLGAGSYLAGRWADRRYRTGPDTLLGAYGYLEVGIGVIGMAVAVIVPHLGFLSAGLSSYVEGADGWFVLSLSSRVLHYLVATVLLLPVTALMGGTLTLLIRHLVRQDLSAAGWHVGVLYGINTAGAAVGAFLVDFTFVPALGLFATQSLAALVNLTVGVVAIRWGRRIASQGASPAPGPARPAEGERVPPPDDGGEPAPARRLVLSTGAAIFLSGFAAMGMEILWFRFLSTALGSNRATFSLLLTVILVGIWLGSLAGGALHRRFGRPALLYMVTQTAFVLSALLLLLAFDVRTFPKAGLIDEYYAAPGLLRPLVEVWAQLRVILCVVGLPAFLMGFAYPLANANVQRAESAVGRRAGMLYLANTVGAVSGALLTGFVLLPQLGMHATITVLGACGLATLPPLLVSSGPWTLRDGRATRRFIAAGGLAAAGAAVLVVWGMQPPHHLAQRVYRPYHASERLIAMSEGIGETIVVTEVPESGARRLYTNGYSMASTRYGGQRYMRAFAHIPLLLQDEPEAVLVICFGVGNTVHAASVHPSVRRLDVVDISRHVLDHAPYFTRWNRDVLRDPRVAVHVNDGRQHLRMKAPESYDLVTLEPPPITHAGVSALYSREFYELVKSRLRPGGYLSQWLPIYQVPRPVLASMLRAFLDVFPEAVLLSGHHNELIMLGRRGGAVTLDPRRVLERLRSRAGVRADLEAVDLASLTEIVGTYVGSSRAMEHVAADAGPVTDDLPLMEYSSVTYRGVTVIPEELFELESVQEWCPRCFDDGRPIAELAHLEAYLAHMRALYASDAFRVSISYRPVAVSPLEVAGDPEALAAVRRQSGYLRRLFSVGP